MRTFFPIWLDRVLIVLGLGAFVFFSLFFVVSELNDTEAIIETPVSKVQGKADTLQSFAQALIIGSANLRLARPSPEMRYLAPRTVVDPMYSLLVLFSSVIIFIFFWDFSYRKPFTGKALLGLRVGAAFMLIFMIANFFRHDWFSEQVVLLTKGEFEYRKPFPLTSPEGILFIVLIRVCWIFKKGIDLQTDLDLTV